MQASVFWKILCYLGLFVAFWLGFRYLLPLVLPFLLGGLIALAAEPVVQFSTRKLHLPPVVATGLGVTVTLLLVLSLLSLTGALAVKELGSLAHSLPDVGETVAGGMELLQDWAMTVADRLPEVARGLATEAAQELFDGRSVLKGQLTSRVPAAMRNFLGWLPGGALGIGTGVLAGFMISARLPKLRRWLRNRMPDSWYSRYRPALGRAGKNILAWLKAQLKLSAVTYGIVTVGFLLLGVSYGPFWAALVAAVDAVPVLGTGTVLLPWALVELIQGNSLRALGLLLTYGAALLTRTILEPRLVGKHLGLDPLVTLLCLYIGCRLWGILGMILAPMLAAAAKGVLQPEISA